METNNLAKTLVAVSHY